MALGSLPAQTTKKAWTSSSAIGHGFAAQPRGERWGAPSSCRRNVQLDWTSWPYAPSELLLEFLHWDSGKVQWRTPKKAGTNEQSQDRPSQRELLGPRDWTAKDDNMG